MKSLKELCSDIIIENDGLDRTVLPEDLKEYLHNLKFNRQLKKLKFEDTDGRDVWSGLANNNIIASLDSKHYVQYNIDVYERWYGYWNGNPQKGNVCFPKVKYVNYYLSQENHFKTKYPQKTNVKRCDFDDCNCFTCSDSYKNYYKDSIY